MMPTGARSGDSVKWTPIMSLRGAKAVHQEWQTARCYAKLTTSQKGIVKQAVPSCAGCCSGKKITPYIQKKDLKKDYFLTRIPKWPC